MPGLRRGILYFTITLLVIAGISGGVIAGDVYAQSDHPHRIAGGAVVGIASAIGSWAIAGLLALFVEIADSLRTLAARE